ncbi:hypothetical protein AB205_0216500 [Aquarana catesbeiana]|uniref:Uncharacterized protein n=1 Tax=Aquarana catesbeiana TaxID=8400 RepID=A0A2G9RCL3_AQUCT|nr:hypothetical protein AB205_0216500 [Aquarana catesbeiana]
MLEGSLFTLLNPELHRSSFHACPLGGHGGHSDGRLGLSCSHSNTHRQVQSSTLDKILFKSKKVNLSIKPTGPKCIVGRGLTDLYCCGICNGGFDMYRTTISSRVE